MAQKYSIGAQVNEAKRQLAMMEIIYPDMVKLGRLDQSAADIDKKIMKAVVETLEWMEKHEKAIRSAVAAGALKGAAA